MSGLSGVRGSTEEGVEQGKIPLDEMNNGFDPKDLCGFTSQINHSEKVSNIRATFQTQSICIGRHQTDKSFQFVFNNWYSLSLSVLHIYKMYIFIDKHIYYFYVHLWFIWHHL